MEKHFCRNILFVVGMFFCSSVFSMNKDSLKIKNYRGFYFNVAYGPIFDHINGSYASKYADLDMLPYQYENKKNVLHSPFIGAGYVWNNELIFAKLGVNYFFDSKKYPNNMPGIARILMVVFFQAILMQ